MEHVTLDEIDNVPNPLGIHTVRKPISGAVDADHVAVTFYELEPGEAFSGGLHTHNDQEELFYVSAGTATFEVGEDRTEIRIGPEEVVRFAPGEFQTGRNESDGPVTGLAISGPGTRHEWSECDVLLDCEDCGEETVWTCGEDGPGDWENREIDLVITCQECGNSIATADLD